MPENVLAFWETVKDVLLFDKVVKGFTELWDKIPDWIFEFYYDHRVPCLIVAICLLALFAFEGYKLFKMALYVISSGTFAALGYYYVAPAVVKYAGEYIPEIIETSALVALICALLALFLTRFAYQFMIMILGGVCGYFFGHIYVWRVIRDFFDSLAFLKTPVARYIVGGVFAAVAVLLFILMFKHVFMVGSAFGSMVFAAILAQKLLVPSADDMVKISFVLVGVAIGVFAVVRQYKEEEKAMEIVF